MLHWLSSIVEYSYRILHVHIHLLISEKNDPFHLYTSPHSLLSISKQLVVNLFAIWHVNVEVDRAIEYSSRKQRFCLL